MNILYIILIKKIKDFFKKKMKSTKKVYCWYVCGFLGGSVVKNPPASAGDRGDAGSILGSGRSPGVGNGNLLQYSCLENSMDRGAQWAIVHRVAKS